MHLLDSGIMCRGYITRGPIFHTHEHFPIGTGYQRAYEFEAGKRVTAFKRDADERGTPYVEVDRVVCDYISQYCDSCVQKIFSRCVKDDGAVHALFPFKSLGHQFVIGGPLAGVPFDSEKERRANQNVRAQLERYKERVMTFIDMLNPSAVAKAEHYIACLDTQLEQCDRTDEFIASLESPSPRQQ
jgi:hypothetical protein